MVTVKVGGNIGAKQVLSWLIRLFCANIYIGWTSGASCMEEPFKKTAVRNS